MKKNILLLLAAQLFIGAIQAQCHITVTGSFDSECIYDYKDQTPTDEYTDLMVACKNSTVTYTAHLDFISLPVTYSWAVTGDAQAFSTASERSPSNITTSAFGFGAADVASARPRPLSPTAQ